MRLLLGWLVAASVGTAAAAADTPPSVGDLAGLWRAQRAVGPEVAGPLTLWRAGTTWTADIAGRTAPVIADGSRISFTLADGGGAFRGRLRGPRIFGHWIQPRTTGPGGGYALPIVLEPRGPGRWVGMVRPLLDTTTLFLQVAVGEGSPAPAFMRNPDRNVTRFLNVEHVSLEGDKVTLLGGRRPKGAPEVVVGEGTYHADEPRISIDVPARGATYDFERVVARDGKGFLPRAPGPYVYHPPPAEDDGWPVGTLDDVRISREAITAFVQTVIDTPIASMHASDLHGVLIARHGRLVLEEYFHGFHRDALHDTRSAAKVLATTTIGAAMLHGEAVSAATPVYETMTGAAFGLDPRKRAMTLEHLLTMSSGLDCDDSDPDSPGAEDTMQQQDAQPDWYRFTLDLGMVRAPGEKAVYCSVNPNLAGGVLAKRTGKWVPDLFHDLVAEPLDIHRYALNLTPTGEAYIGGGAQFAPRDFMKLGQLMLDGGLWRGRRVLARDWVRAAVAPHVPLQERKYGYLWWLDDYPYEGRRVQAFYAAGNGGQIVMGVPALDLVIAFYGGNYGDAAALIPQRVLVPEMILPAVH